MHNKIATFLILGFLALPAVVAAQSDNPPQKQEIRVNDLEVIYDDDEYPSVVAPETQEPQEEENLMYQVPFLRQQEREMQEFEELQEDYTFSQTDDGAFSEEDILIEGFDTALIHLPKADVRNMGPTIIQLRDAEHKFTWPTPWTSRPSSHFGPRRRRFHYGLDLAQPTGEPIYAAFDGVVRISKLNRSYGNLVIIHHSNGLETYYAHMSKRYVVAGQHVKSGDVIGLCGNTGRSFGSHLHFEVRYQGNAINPEHVINCATHDLVADELTLTSSSFRKVASSNGSSKSTASGTASGGWYRVRQGDTLEKIARRNGTTVRRLCQLNGISETKILHPGDRLKVSGNASATPPKETKSSSGSGSTTYYTVRQGDTLSKIASRQGTTVRKLCQLNGIKENSVLRVGQKIRVK